MTYMGSEGLTVTTLALGDLYRKHVTTLIQSVLKFTPYDAYIITDKPEEFGNYFGPRIHFIQFDETITDMPFTNKVGMFNYNLKLVPIQWVANNIRPSIICYMDCDSFWWGNAPSMLHRYFVPDDGIWARFRNSLNDSDSHQLILEKVKTMNIDITDINTRLPIENIMFFKNGPMLSSLLETWKKYSTIAVNSGARTDFEAIELCLAIHEIGMPHTHICQDILSDCFRTLHHGHLHIPFVI